jgi:hypothetical protein
MDLGKMLAEALDNSSAATLPFASATWSVADLTDVAGLTEAAEAFLAKVREAESHGIDYRSLLRRYMNAVGEAEGVTFLGWLGGKPGEPFYVSEAEEAALNAIDQEGQAEVKAYRDAETRKVLDDVSRGHQRRYDETDAEYRERLKSDPDHTGPVPFYGNVE